MAETNAPDLRIVEEQEGGPDALVGECIETLGGRSASTLDAYGRILRSLAGWVSERPGGSGGFRPELFTRTALETYLKELEGRGYSVSHRSRVKSVASGFAGWLIQEKGLMRKNPTRGVEVPAQVLLAPRRLSSDQRYVLKNLVERDGKVRSEAIFPDNFLKVVEKLRFLKELGLSPGAARSVHHNRLSRLAAEGARMTPQNLSTLEGGRRRATLVAYLLERAASLTDEALEMHDRMVGEAMAGAKRTRDENLKGRGKEVNEKVGLYAAVKGEALRLGTELGPGAG